MNALIDTNILFYAFDNSEPKKQAIAKGIVSKAFKEGAVISSQVLGEFYYQVRKKLKPAQIEEGKIISLAIIKSENWKKISYTEKTLWKSIEKSQDARDDFWDLIIYFTMLENNVTELITENEKDFQHLSGIRILNPFKK